MALLFNIFSLSLAALLAYLYLYGVEHSFLWIYPQFDTYLHLLGGTVMGFWACAVAVRLHRSMRGAFVLVGMVALVGGLAWEAFEATLGLQGGVADSLSDVFFGVIGAYAAYLVYLALMVRRAV
jgi:hypothetical protein